MVNTVLRRGSLPSLLVLALTLVAADVHALCDVIPQPTDRYRGALGEATRSFAAPGRRVRVAVRPAICNQATRSTSPGLPLNASDYAVSIVFTPLAPAAPRNMVVLRSDCTGVAPNSCALPNGGTVTCLDANVNPLAKTAVDVGGGVFENRLGFDFPTTSAPGPPAGNTLTGPARLVVTRATDPLPCNLGATRCAASTTPMVACIDELYEADSSCRTGVSAIDPTFGHFVALPVENEFEDFCVPDPADVNSPCNAPGPVEVRFALDPLGNLYFPFNYDAVLVRVDDEPFPLLISADMLTSAFPAGADPPDFDRTGGESRALNGRLLPPIFQTVEDPDDLGRIFGSVDAVAGVHRFFRFSPGFGVCTDDGGPCNEDDDCPSAAPGSCVPATCVGGNNAGAPCTKHNDCLAGGGACGAALFDLSSLVSGEGCGSGLAEATSTIDGIVNLNFLVSGESTDLALATEVEEPVLGMSVNFDSDQDDTAIIVRNRNTNAVLPIGQAGADGRALTPIRIPPFELPGADVSEDVVAFLEGEPLEGDCDAFPLACDGNQNLSVFESLLRAFRVTDESADDLLPAGVENLAVEPSPLVNGQAIVVSDGLVFFRVSDGANRVQETALASLASNPTPGDDFSVEADLSANSEVVVFSSLATNLDLVTPDLNGVSDVFRHDRTTGATTRVSLPDQSCAAAAVEANGPSAQPSVSEDGRYVAFMSFATNLTPGTGDANGAIPDVYVHDTVTCETRRVSVATDGTQSNGFSQSPSLSADGSRVAFQSLATNLVTPDANPAGWDVFVHDLGSGETTLESLSTAGAQGNDDSIRPAIAGNGDAVAFESDAGNLDPADANPAKDVFVRGPADTTLRSAGSDAISRKADCDADCDQVAFESDAEGLVEDDLNSSTDVFVNDLASGVTRRASTSSTGGEASGLSTDPALSGNGRFAAFASSAGDLVPNDANGFRDVFVKDLITGFVKRVSANAAGVGGDADSGSPSVSDDGQFVAFESGASNLGPAVGGAETNVFVHGPLGYEEEEEGDLLTQLGVLDTRSDPAEVLFTGQAVSRVAVAAGAAGIVDETIQLFRFTCDGAGGPTCRDDTECGGGTCQATVEDLLRPGVDVALSDQFLCALTNDGAGADPTVACHTIGDPPDQSLEDVLLQNGAPAPGANIAVCGSNAAFLSPQLDGTKLLHTVDLSDPDARAVPVQTAEDFVLGDESCLLGFRTAEADLGADGNGDGDQLDAIFHVVQLPVASPPAPKSCMTSAVPCTFSACDPRSPYTCDQTCKFLTDENEERDLNNDGTLGFIVQHCSPGGNLSLGPPFNQNSNQNPVSQGAQTVVGQTLRCRDPLGVPGDFCDTAADCPVGHGCGQVLTTALEPDADADGVPDATDNCPNTPNTEQEDSDGDGVGDVCDRFSCGDDVTDEFESCDDGEANGSEESLCTDGCTPRVRLEVLQEAINLKKKGNIPVAALGSPFLNLDTTPIAGLIPDAQAIDVTTLRMTAIDDDDEGEGEGCIEEGDEDEVAEPVHDLTDPTVYADHLEDVNDDGILDLVQHYDAEDLDLEEETEEFCLLGTLSGETGLFGVTDFEARDQVNVFMPPCGLGSELVFLMPALWAAHGLARRRRRS